MTMRSLAELTAGDEDAWQSVLTAAAASESQVLPVASADADRCLLALQATSSCTLGSMAHRCAGVLVDHGWLRLQGAGNTELPGLDSINGLESPPVDRAAPSALVVGLDVLGGRFAIDGGGLGVAPGEVCYWAPDTLAWEGLEIGHTAFVMSFLEGASRRFYADWRWRGWQDEVGALRTDEALATWPPPFSAEGQDLSAVSRRGALD